MAANVLAAMERRMFLRRHGRGGPDRPPAWSLGFVAAAVAALGDIMATYLVTLSA